MQNRAIKVDEKTYDHAKLLLNGGATLKVAAEHLGLSTWTVGMIGRSENMEEYKHMCSSRYEKKGKKEKKPDPKPENPEQKNDNPPDLKLPGGTMSGAYMMNRIIHLLEDQNKSLELISKKLAFIVEQLS